MIAASCCHSNSSTTPTSTFLTATVLFFIGDFIVAVISSTVSTSVVMMNRVQTVNWWLNGMPSSQITRFESSVASCRCVVGFRAHCVFAATVSVMISLHDGCISEKFVFSLVHRTLRSSRWQQFHTWWHLHCRCKLLRKNKVWSCFTEALLLSNS